MGKNIPTKVTKKPASSDDSDSEDKVQLAKRTRLGSNASSDNGRKKAAPSKGVPAKAGAKKVADSSDSESDDHHAAGSESDNDDHEEVANAEDADKLELFVKSLSFDVDSSMLHTIFSKYGAMAKCKLVEAGGRSRGIAFIEYEKAADAAKAKKGEDGQEHCGRTISVEYSGQKGGAAQTTVSTGESNTLFCGNIGFHTTEDSVRAFFHKAGEITSVRIAMGDDGRARGFCHIEFGTPA
mgnify:CR=1 FL=1|jgi:nucleolin